MMWEDRGNVGHIRESVSVSLTEHMGLRSGSANSVCVCVRVCSRCVCSSWQTARASCPLELLFRLDA